MSVKDLITKLQREINEVKKAGGNCDLDDWVFDHINEMQRAINDFVNQDFKSSEQDPFG